MTDMELIVLQVLTSLIMVAGGYYLGFNRGKEYAIRRCAEATALMMCGTDLLDISKTKKEKVSKKVKSSKRSK
jgi:hypothetical protein